ncbi:hypothetical protein ACN28E_50850 [Archangium lansingense]|uniref:hypothetical protein n=1 Tax=Archangium lansingense TaxID=2995310 RepID=UPI003B776A17
MSHASKLLLLSCLTCAFACTVPTIEELDKEHPIEKCSAEHNTCAPGSVCFEDQCIPYEGLDCKPGDRRACGSSVGECRPGTELCGAKGTFGACQPEVGPVRETCDGKDNDCDGAADNWKGALELTRNHDNSAPAAAVAVRRSSDDTRGTLLTLTSEDGKLVTRTLGADGTWMQAKTFAHPQMSFKMPVLAAHGDTVAAAWLGVKSPVGTEPPVHQVLLTLMDGSGFPITTQVLDIPHVEPFDSSIPVQQLRVAINKSHVLVLILAANKSFAVIVSRNLDAGSRKGPFALGTVHPSWPADRWFSATVGGKGEEFLVAYERYSVAATNGFITKYNYTLTITNEGALGLEHLINNDPDVHSPFMLPLQGDPWEHTVYFARADTSLDTSWIASLRCQDRGCGQQQAEFFTYGHRLRRMQLVARPGAPMPEAALLRWQDSNMRSHALTAVTFADKAPSYTELQPSGQPTLSESLIVMPDSIHHLLYNQDPPPPSTVSSLAVGFSVTEAHVLTFCNP